MRHGSARRYLRGMSKELSNALAEAVTGTAAGIVRINGRPRIPSTGIIWSDDTIVTANHTLHSDDEVDAGFDDGREGRAKLIGRDSSTDIAVLRVEDRRPRLSISREEAHVGNIVLALGRPGKSVRATFGIISALGEEWRTRGGGRVDRYIEVDGTLPAGFSGGPLIDLDGRCLGMNTSRLMRGGTTIPSTTLTRIVEEIVAHGTIRRPFLGIAVYPVEEGLLVISVKRGSAAHDAGILVGDIITAPRSLRETLEGLPIGSETTLQIKRGGEAKEVRLTIGGQ
jgi:S1-C subfamily serine protease